MEVLQTLKHVRSFQAMKLKQYAQIKLHTMHLFNQELYLMTTQKPSVIYCKNYMLVRIYKKCMLVFTPPVVCPVLLKAVSVGLLSLSSHLQTPAYAQETAAPHPCTNPDHTRVIQTYLPKMQIYIHAQPNIQGEGDNINFS